jgi:hypothetical protein
MSQILVLECGKTGPAPTKSVTIAFSLRKEFAIRLHELAVHDGITIHQAAKKLVEEASR